MEENNEIKNALQVFSNPEFGEIRTIEIDSEPWFVGADVARGLGYADPFGAIMRHVDSEDTLKQGILSKGGIQQTKLINESGLYALIIMSELPSAKKFKRWVTKEVIPSVMRTGSYTHPKLSQIELVAQIAQNHVELERRISATEERSTAIEQKLDTAVKIFATSDRSWKENMELAIKELDGNSVKLKIKLYRELEAIADASLQSRLLRRQARMKKNGATYRERQAITKLDIISYDKKLRLIFEGIVKKYQALEAASEKEN